MRSAVAGPARLWRRSLTFRVVATTVGLSVLVIAVLGQLLITRVESGLLGAKEEKAAAEGEKQAAKDAKLKEELEKKKAKSKSRTTSRRMSPLQKAGNQAARSAGREAMRYVLRGIFGTMKR